jgi:hypothetical protein
MRMAGSCFKCCKTAIAIMASFIQILVNMIGWYAERTKLEVQWEMARLLQEKNKKR